MALKSARKKGSNYELQLVRLFKDFGYKSCCTSRLESKARDFAGIDLCNSGIFEVQAKAVEKLGPPHPILAKMPKTKGKINLLFHKKNHSGSVVSMTQEDFVTIVKMLIKSGQIKPE